jgi:hypothetical protein
MVIFNVAVLVTLRERKAPDVGFPAALFLVITHIIVAFVTTRVHSLVGYAVPSGTHFCKIHSLSQMRWKG